jgi:hypothetical protein
MWASSSARTVKGITGLSAADRRLMGRQSGISAERPSWTGPGTGRSRCGPSAAPDDLARDAEGSYRFISRRQIADGPSLTTFEAARSWVERATGHEAFAPIRRF